MKKRILEELDVPPEVRCLGFDLLQLPQGVFPLYRDRFTGEMMMFLRLWGSESDQNGCKRSVF